MINATETPQEVDLQIFYFNKLIYAMQQHGIGLIQKLLINNISAKEDLALELSLRPSVAPPIVRHLGRVEAGSSLEITDIIFDWDAEHLEHLSEKQLIHLDVTLKQGEELCLKECYPIDLLPPDTWLGSAILPELLCSFVTPNAAELAQVLHNAAVLLKNWSGSASFNAYMSQNEDIVRCQMAAIYQAIADLGIVYNLPPADFEKLGQRIRMADQIMEQRMGTCLDMALFYASCLEAVGLNPILVLVEGHAFVGAWLIDDLLNDPVSDDASILRKRMAAGINEMCFVEATAMNAGKGISFEEAVRLVKAMLDADDKFEYAIDVKRCRLGGIRPMGMKSKGYAVQSSFEGQAVDSTPQDLQPRKVLEVEAAPAMSKQRIWERKLLDLSLRNNLLNIRQTRSLIPLMSAQLDVLEDALADGKDFLLLPRPSDWRPDEKQESKFHPITDDEAIGELISYELKLGKLHSFDTEAEASKAYTQLYRSARLAMEENGVNTLYLSLGLLRWYESPASEKARYAPILLLPVEMKRKRGTAGAYSIRSSEEETLVNITLLEMLKQDFAIDLSVINQLPRDEHGIDIKLVFNTLRHLLKNQARWDIEEQALLGTFSFSKFIMWNDIHNNADLLRKNPLVDSLISSQVQWEVPLETEVDLDCALRPADLLLPVAADSYQMEAIYRATQGESFVLHGPPGSGKSQTITNIIANALYHGQRVLFVAEKMAALSVVHKRLSQIGLGPFCLELHSNKATKSSVLDQLEASSKYKLGKSCADFKGESDRLFALRQELRQHVDALHEQVPLGLSVYECLYAIDQLPPAPAQTYRPVGGMSLSMSSDSWRDNRETASRLQSIAKICTCPATHALRDVELQQFSPEIMEQASCALEDLIKTYKELQEARDRATNALALPQAGEEADKLANLLECIDALVVDNGLNATLLRYDNTEEMLKKTQELCELGEAQDKLRAEIGNHFEDTVINIDAQKSLQQWQAAEQTWFLPRILTRWSITSSLRKHAKAGQRVEPEQIATHLKHIITAKQQERDLTPMRSWQQGQFGEQSKDWARLRQSTEAAHHLNQSLLNLLGKITLVKEMRSNLANQFAMGQKAFIQEMGEDLKPYQAAHTQVETGEHKLRELLQIKAKQSGLKARQEELAAMQSALPQLRDWCLWQTSSAKASEQGMSDFVDYIKTQAVAPEQILAEYERGIYQDLLQSQMRRHPIFTQFNGLLFEDLLAKYRELVNINQQLARLELCAKLGSKIPNFERDASQNSELGILQRSIRSRGRGNSIRQLIDKLPELMPRLKPCMLMSPMSVAQYLDAAHEPFDLVIFDEASQMPTCEAVGTIARGKSIIVVGDPRQMPPTSFFSSNSVDEDHLELEDLESILEDCLGLSMPSRHLRWHYRSRHESLIAFSNMQYYENKLLTFPSPDDLCSKLSLVPVPGYYDKGKSRCNKAEAEAVVAEILRHLSDPIKSKQSLGIISFSQVQQSLIEDLLTLELNKTANQHLETIAYGVEESIFIKNLENVQGDERDVIYFSVGYGPDEQGRVSMNFGPLNREGGERRLNVAVSRARYEMKVFSTLKPEQIDLSRSKSLGVAGLRAFLEFAQKGKQALQQKSGNTHVPAPSIIELLAEDLAAKGYSLKSHIGSSAYRVDLAVIHPEKPGEYLAAIISDGASYQAAPTQRDREITRVGVLQSLGWNVLRVWTLDWWMDRKKVIDQLCTQLEQLKEQEQNGQQDNTATIELEQHVDLVELDQAKPESAQRKYPYTVARIAPSNSQGEDPLQGRFAPQMIEQIRTILETEAPVQQEYLTRRIMEAWGLKVLTKRVQAYVNELCERMQLHRTGKGDSISLWKNEQQSREYGIYRVGAEREAKYIPVAELSIASYEILQEQMAMPREDLQAELIERFELGRKTKALRGIIDAGIAQALEQGYIEEEEGRCKLP